MRHRSKVSADPTRTKSTFNPNRSSMNLSIIFRAWLIAILGSVALNAQVVPKENVQHVLGTGNYIGTNSGAQLFTTPASMVSTVAALRALSITGLANGTQVSVAGYYATADGDGGPVRVLSTGQAPGTYTDNGGSIIVPTGGNGSAAWLYQNQLLTTAGTPTFASVNIPDGSTYGSAYKYNNSNILFWQTAVENLYVGVGAGNLSSAISLAGLAAKSAAHLNEANTGVGAYALYVNTDGVENTAVGYQALFRNVFDNNTAVGSHCLFFNTSGDSNTAVGAYALYTNTTGYWNTAIGLSSTSANTTGFSNTAIGEYSLAKNTTGSGGVAAGVAAAYGNTTGNDNVAIGTSALRLNTTGYSNTAIGVNSLNGLNITADDGTGYNTAIGALTGLGIVTGVNNTIIGAHVSGLAASLSNNIILANGTGAVKGQHDGSDWTFTGKVMGDKDVSFNGGVSVASVTASRVSAQGLNLDGTAGATTSIPIGVSDATFVFYGTATQTATLQCLLATTGNGLDVIVNGGGAIAIYDGGLTTLLTTGSILPGKLFFLVVKRDSAGYAASLNGGSYSVSAGSIGTNVGSVTRIGCGAADADFWTGPIRPMVFNRALTSSESLALYQTGAVPPSAVANLICYPTPSQLGRGPVWYDSSGNGANLTLPALGVTWAIPTPGYGTVTLTTGAGTITDPCIVPSSTILLTMKTASGAASYPLVTAGTGSATVAGLATDSGTYTYRVIF